MAKDEDQGSGQARPNVVLAAWLSLATPVLLSVVPCTGTGVSERALIFLLFLLGASFVSACVGLAGMGPAKPRVILVPALLGAALSAAGFALAVFVLDLSIALSKARFPQH